MSSSVSPASATAARHASTVNDSGSTMSRRPSAERPTPESTARCSKRSVLTGAARRRAFGLGDQLVGRVGRAGRFEQRQPHVLVRLEPNRHLLADVDVVRVAADDVRREVHRRVVGERDHRDRVRRLEAGQPLVLVDREADDGRAPGNHRRAPRAAAARGADRHGRVHQRLAIVAALHAQLPVRAGGPEPLVDRRELRKRPHLRTCRRGTRPRPLPRGTTP